MIYYNKLMFKSSLDDRAKIKYTLYTWTGGISRKINLMPVNKESMMQGQECSTLQKHQQATSPNLGSSSCTLLAWLDKCSCCSSTVPSLSHHLVQSAPKSLHESAFKDKVDKASQQE